MKMKWLHNPYCQESVLFTEQGMEVARIYKVSYKGGEMFMCRTLIAHDTLEDAKRTAEEVFKEAAKWVEVTEKNKKEKSKNGREKDVL